MNFEKLQYTIKNTFGSMNVICKLLTKKKNKYILKPNLFNDYVIEQYTANNNFFRKPYGDRKGFLPSLVQHNSFTIIVLSYCLIEPQEIITFTLLCYNQMTFLLTKENRFCWRETPV